METAEDPCWVDALDDQLLGRVFLLAGKDQKQCQGVCRRWRRVWFSDPGLWQRLRLSPPVNAATQLAIVQRTAPLVEVLMFRGIGDKRQVEQRPGAAEWNLPAVLAAHSAGRQQRLQELRLSTEMVRFAPTPLVFWQLHECDSLSAAAMRKVGHLRALRVLELDSWQLPHCTAGVLGRLTQLSRLRLRARQLPPGILPGAIDEQLTQLRSLMLETSMPCSPVGISQLTALSGLTRLAVHQANTAGAALVPPRLDRLPLLASACFEHLRGPVLLPGGGRSVGRAELVRRGSFAALALSCFRFEDPLTSLAALLDALVPPGVTLDRLQAARLTYDSPAALQGCSHLGTLRSLSLDGLFHHEGGSRAGGVHALLGQAPGLTELRMNYVLTDEEDGEFCELHHALVHHTALRKLDLGNNSLPDLSATTLPVPPFLFLLNVEHLDLSCCNLRRLPESALLSAPSLRTLRLAGNSEMLFYPYNSRAIARLDRLQELDLMGVPICPAEVARLARYLPDLELKLDSVIEPLAEPARPPPPVAAVLADGWDVPEEEQ